MALNDAEDKETSLAGALELSWLGDDVMRTAFSGNPVPSSNDCSSTAPHSLFVSEIAQSGCRVSPC